MAQQDKTDWYWNGVLAGAVNNLYYDLINVDVVHTPYSTTHRNSSFFLKTRPGYCVEDAWFNGTDTEGWDVTDLKIIWNENCDEEEGIAYALGKKGKSKAIFACPIKDGCATHFFNCSENCTPRTTGDFYDECPDMSSVEGCGDWKLFVTDYVKGDRYDGFELIKQTGAEPLVHPGSYTGIQINKYSLGTTLGYFSDEYVESGDGEFKGRITEKGNYLLVYASATDETGGFPGQVRMITGTETSDGVTRIMVDSPWLGFKVPDTSNLSEGESKSTYPNEGLHVSYAVFEEWGQVVGFTDNNKIFLMTNDEDCRATRLYAQDSEVPTNIIGVAEANDKVFVLTDNGFVHYSKEGIGYNKFFMDDDMFAGADKSSIIAYRDMILAFGSRHISVGVPDEQNRYWTMYDQSTTMGTWSRYSYAEYDGDLVFVSNDKRLMTLGINSASRYGLVFDDVGEMLNGKLATLSDTDEVFIGSSDNNLRVFVQTKSEPYIAKPYPWEGVADRNLSGDNTMTHIYKFDTLFKVWSEDHVSFLLSGASDGAYYGQNGIYSRRYSEALSPDGECDIQGTHDKKTYWPYQTKISAYLIENESDWVGGTSSRLANRPKLYNVAKLNRLITTLGPGVYSNTSKIKITTYSKGIGYTYEFPISGDGNDWLGLVTSYYTGKKLSEDEEEKLGCMVSTIQDSQKQYQNNCPESDVYYHTEVQKTPRCQTYREFLIQDHGVCINDKLYEIAPTMPLTTNLGENQDYATQIKLELIGGKGDVICFGGRLAEMFIAPLFSIGPDGEYQLQPNTDC